MRRLILKIFLSEPSIFNRNLKFLCLGSKRVQIFILSWTKFEAAQNGFEFALFASWMLQELLYLGPEQRLRRLLSSICVQNQYRATPATFRLQIEQYCRKCSKIKQPIRKRHWKSELFQNANRAIWTHLEQPQIRFRTKWKIWTLFEPQLKKLKCL
jgi:hypothetical protein